MAGRRKKAIDVVAGADAQASEYNDVRFDLDVVLKLVAAEQDAPDLTLQVSEGVVSILGTIVKFAGGNSGTFTAPSADPRIDLLSIDDTGTLNITTGVEAASPTVPDYPVDQFVIAEIFNRVGQTTVLNETVAGEGFIQRDARPFTTGAGQQIVLDEGETLAVGDPVGVTGVNEVKKAFFNAFGGFGSETQVDSASINDMGLAQIADNKFVIAWNQTGVGAFAIIATVSNKVFTFGSKVQVSSDTGLSGVDVCKVGTDKFVAVYSKNNVSVRAKVGTVSGTSITLGSEVSRATDARFVRCAQMATNKFAWITKGGNTDLLLQINTVSGTTITQGSFVNIDIGESGFTGTEDGNRNSIAQVTTDKGVIAFRNGSTNTIYVILFTISGTTPTLGTQVPFVTGQTIFRALDIICPTATNLVVAYQKSSDTTGKLRAATISGTVPTFGTEAEFNSGDIGSLRINIVESGRGLVAYLDASNSNFGTVIGFDISGSTVSNIGGLIAKTVFSSSGIQNVLGLADYSASDNFATIGFMLSSKPTLIAIENFNTPINVIGTVQKLLSGNRVVVKIGGIDPNQSGLTAGDRIYAVDGAISTSAENGETSFIGVAISATELLITL